MEAISETIKAAGLDLESTYINRDGIVLRISTRDSYIGSAGLQVAFDRDDNGAPYAHECVLDVLDMLDDGALEVYRAP
jgi:hypothetical protein